MSAFGIGQINKCKTEFMVIQILQNQLLTIFAKLMDNQYSDSDKQIEINCSQSKKPNNRSTFTHKSLVVDSNFQGGNLKSASFQEQFRMQGKIALVVEFWGNSDAQVDPLDKCWFCFSVTGIKWLSQMNYEQIIFRFKNANIYRKFIRQKRYKPYVMVKQQRQAKDTGPFWQAIYVSKINILQNQLIQAEFVYTIESGVDKAFFAENLPYNFSDLQIMHQNINNFIQTNQNKRIYYHREVIARSADDNPVYMCTVTSALNILTIDQTQPQIWGFKSARPFQLKNRPQIVITSRVHPSEISSSYCVQGIIESLIKNSDFQFLTNAFIFRIIPMINPDGVKNGHYRLDNYLQNLNRFYGHSDQTQTPSIFSVQKLMSYLRQKNKFFFFMDIHGHNSPKPSFIFGNFCQNFFQIIQNKSFVKLMENFSQGNFDSSVCQFSKRHMTIKQKYDQHSKQASARVFAYRGNSQQENNQTQNKFCTFVQHSYTLQVHPYVISDPIIRKGMVKKQNKQTTNSFKNLPKINNLKRSQTSGPTELNQFQIIEQYKKIGENVLNSIQEMLGVNIGFKLHELEDCQAIRKRNFKDISKLPQFYERSKKSRSKEINREFFDKYYQKWNLLQVYRQFITNSSVSIEMKMRFKDCPIQYIYDQWAVKRDRMDQLNTKRMRIIRQNRQKVQQLPISNLNSLQNIQNVQQNQQKQGIEQQDIRKFKTIASNTRKNTNQVQTIKQIKPIKSVEFQMIQKLEYRQTKPEGTLKSTIGQQKKSVNPKLSEIETLQRKIRKLMFRHKTQNHILDLDENEVNIIISSDQKHQVQGQNNKIYNRKLSKEKQVFNNRLEPLSKNKKNKATHLKTQQNKRHHMIQFNDKQIVDKIEEKECKRRDIFLQGIPPRIDQFVKKLSVHKYDFGGSQGQKIGSQQQLLRIRASNMSNLVISRRKKSLTRISSQEDDKQRQKYVILKSDISSKNKNSVFQTNLLSSYIYEATLSNELNNKNYEQNSQIIEQKLAGCHKSVKSNMKRNHPNKDHQNEQEVHNIVRSFRVLGSQQNNKQEFAQKARKILSQKKRQLKPSEQPLLPIIKETDSFGQLSGRKLKQ